MILEQNALYGKIGVQFLRHQTFWLCLLLGYYILNLILPQTHCDRLLTESCDEDVRQLGPGLGKSVEIRRGRREAPAQLGDGGDDQEDPG